MRLIHNWREILWRAWSVRIAAFWGLLLGLLSVWDVFADHVPIGVYVGVAIVGNIAIAIARVLDQPGLD